MRQKNTDANPRHGGGRRGRGGRGGRGCSGAQFRELLSRFATGVTIVTAVDEDGNAHGMTASSLASVSLEPPLLSVCVAKNADFHQVLRRAPRFAVNVLAAGQDDLARAFSSTDVDPFKDLQVDENDGLPFLGDTAASISCELWDCVEAGDHTIFIALVLGGEVRDGGGGPLIHYRSKYTTTR